MTDRGTPAPAGLSPLTADLLSSGISAPQRAPSAVRPSGRRWVATAEPRPAIGPYEAVAQLTPGAGLDIFLAHRISPLGFLGRVILKRARRGAPDFAEGRRRLFEEAHALAFLAHPGVPSLVDVAEDEQASYLAREMVDGTDLAQIAAALRARGEALPFELAAFVTSEVARACHHAHTAEAPDGRPLALTHQGVWPGHVLVARTGHVRVIGFGRTPMRTGTVDPGASTAGRADLGYVPPEVLGGTTPTASSDVYAIGVLLFELLTGRPCFKAKVIGDLLQKIVKNELRLERLDDEGVPRELRRIVERACQHEPTQRFASAADLANALDTWTIQSNLHGSPWMLAAFCSQHGLVEPPERWVREPVRAPSPAQRGVATLPPPPRTSAPPDPSHQPTSPGVPSPLLRGDAAAEATQRAFRSPFPSEPETSRGLAAPRPTEPPGPVAAGTASLRPRGRPDAADVGPPAPAATVPRAQAPDTAAIAPAITLSRAELPGAGAPLRALPEIPAGVAVPPASTAPRSRPAPDTADMAGLARSRPAPDTADMAGLARSRPAPEADDAGARARPDAPLRSRADALEPEAAARSRPAPDALGRARASEPEPAAIGPAATLPRARPDLADAGIAPALTAPTRARPDLADAGVAPALTAPTRARPDLADAGIAPALTAPTRTRPPAADDAPLDLFGLSASPAEPRPPRPADPGDDLFVIERNAAEGGEPVRARVPGLGPPPPPPRSAAPAPMPPRSGAPTADAPRTRIPPAMAAMASAPEAAARSSEPPAPPPPSPAPEPMTFMPPKPKDAGRRSALPMPSVPPADARASGPALIAAELESLSDPGERAADARTLPAVASPMAKRGEPSRAPAPRAPTEPEGPPTPTPTPAAPRAMVAPWSGDLSATRAPDVLARLVAQRATGAVELRAGAVWKRLTLRDGRAVALSSNVGLEGIGEQLVRAKLLTRFDLDRTLRETPQGEDGLVDRLIATQVLSAAQIAPEIARSITEGLVDAFGWRQGTFDFKPSEVESPPVDPALDLGEWLANREAARPSKPSGPITGKKR